MKLLNIIKPDKCLKINKYFYANDIIGDDIKSITTHSINIDNVINNNKLGYGNTPQIIKPVKPHNLLGKVITFNKPYQSQQIDKNDVNEFDIILSCGLGGGSSEKQLFKSFYPISQLIDNSNIAVYSSLTDADRINNRFIKGLPYYYNEFYINREESENFFNKVFKYRFFNNDGKLKLPNEVNQLLLIGFSIGHRENKSHTNFLYEKISQSLEKENKEKCHIKNYFKKIKLVNIGSPVNWTDKKLRDDLIIEIESGKISPKDINEYIKKDLNIFMDFKIPYKIYTENYRSINDTGTAKPISDFNNFHCNANLFNSKIYKFNRNDNDVMYLFGSGLVSNVSLNQNQIPKYNILGHNLENYAEAIYKNCKIGKNYNFQYNDYNFDVNKNASITDNAMLSKEWTNTLILAQKNIKNINNQKYV